MYEYSVDEENDEITVYKRRCRTIDFSYILSHVEIEGIRRCYDSEDITDSLGYQHKLIKISEKKAMEIKGFDYKFYSQKDQGLVFLEGQWYRLQLNEKLISTCDEKHIAGLNWIQLRDIIIEAYILGIQYYDFIVELHDFGEESSKLIFRSADIDFYKIELADRMARTLEQNKYIVTDKNGIRPRQEK
jgi:hypothetical protein